MMHFQPTLLMLLLLAATAKSEVGTFEILSNWNAGYHAKASVLLSEKVGADGWILTLKFSGPVKSVDQWTGNQISSDGQTFEIENRYYNAQQSAGSNFEITMNVYKQTLDENPATATVTLKRRNVGGGGGEETTSAPVTTNPLATPAQTQPQVVTQSPPVSTTPPQSGAYNYNEVLHKSILFYEAQRSGKLPTNNRVSWRKDSALNDRGENGEDLTGGWYDAGDYVKFGFPMASSATVLAWGLVEYREAYQSAGELSNVLDSIKWATDYFIKAHTAKYEFYGQVGNGGLDHAYWGRPEDMTMARPAYKITQAKPGSDLAAETAAALAAASIAFMTTDSDYARTLVRHARELYEFADLYRGKYSDSIQDAGHYYRSHNGFKDELVWGAAWLYRATQDQRYLSKAEQYYSKFGLNSNPWSFSWDEKTPGAQLLLAKVTGKTSYNRDVQTFLDSWLPGGDVPYTPKGLAWRAKWAPNRYSANVAFLALLAADMGLKPSVYRGFARKQIHYMLGDTGRSYVVGFGTNPPQRPHHASSSCPLAPSSCGWNEFNNPGPNPQVLQGALVGGPDQNDQYQDRRNDYIMNEVTTDYNAGFQSAVAGLIHLKSGK